MNTNMQDLQHSVQKFLRSATPATARQALQLLDSAETAQLHLQKARQQQHHLLTILLDRVALVAGVKWYNVVALYDAVDVLIVSADDLRQQIGAVAWYHDKYTSAKLSLYTYLQQHATSNNNNNSHQQQQQKSK